MTTPATPVAPVWRRSAVIVAILVAAALLSFRTTYEPDLWWHLAQGRASAAGAAMRTNLFSFTAPDYPQPYTSWLFEVGAHALWAAGGAVAIQLGQTLLMALALGLAYRACRHRGPTAAALATLMLGLFVIEPRAIPRPHLFSFVGIAWCTLLIERSRQRHVAEPLWGAAAVVALWGNFHVECVFGVALVGMYAVGEFARPEALSRREAGKGLAAAVACALATVANPYGTGLVRYLWENASVPAVIRIAELQPPYWPNYAPFYAYLVGGAALLALARPLRIALWELLVFAAFAALALQYLRFTAFFVFATAPIVAARLGRMIDGGLPGRAALAIAAAAGLLLCRMTPGVYLGELGVGISALQPPAFFSAGAVAFARRVGLRGNVFNSQNLGGFLEWEMYPDVRTFSDSRLQAYPAQHFRDVMAAYRSQPAWDRLVAGVDWAVLSNPRRNELSGAGRFPRQAWATVYWDDAVEVLVRRSGAFGRLASSHEYAILIPDYDPFGPASADASAEARLVTEAQRNRGDNRFGFTARAVLCLRGEQSACDEAAALSDRRPDLRRAIGRMQRLGARGVLRESPPSAAPSDPQARTDHQDYEDYVSDLMAFTKESREAVVAKMKDGAALMRAEWNTWESQGVMTPERIKAFYKQTPNYPYDLGAWHFTEKKRRDDLDLVKRLVDEYHAKNVLDFGCGVGSNALMLARAGLDVTIADLDSKTLDFARFRAQRRDLKMKVWKTDVEPAPPDKKYDVILALHVFDLIPKDELRLIVDSLAKLKGQGTHVVVEAPFGRTPSHPMHLDADDETRALVARFETEPPRR